MMTHGKLTVKQCRAMRKFAAMRKAKERKRLASAEPRMSFAAEYLRPLATWIKVGLDGTTRTYQAFQSQSDRRCLRVEVDGETWAARMPRGEFYRMLAAV